MSSNAAELEREAARLRAIIDGPSERERAAAELADVERQIAARRQAKAEATARLLGIKKAYPSLRGEYDEDEARVRECIKALNVAIETWNTRYERLHRLEEEARGLNKVHLLELLEFANLKSPERVVPPAFVLRDLPLVSLVERPRVVVEHATEPERPRPKRDAAREARALARFGTAAPTPGYK